MGCGGGCGGSGPSPTKTMATCKVCEICDGDKGLKECNYCTLCSNYICKTCEPNMVRRAQAFGETMVEKIVGVFNQFKP